MTDEATLATVVQSQHSVIPLPAPPQAPGQQAQNPDTKSVRDWFSGLVGTYSSATGQQLTPALKTGNPPIVRVINMDMYLYLLRKLEYFHAMSKLHM